MIAAAPKSPIASGALLTRHSGYTLATPLNEVAALVPIHGSQPGEGFVVGSVSFQREPVALVSIAGMLGVPRRPGATQALVVLCRGIPVAIEVDAVVELERGTGMEYHEMPLHLSELPHGLLRGWMLAGGIGGFVVNPDAMFDDDALAEIIRGSGS